MERSESQLKATVRFVEALDDMHVGEQMSVLEKLPREQLNSLAAFVTLANDEVGRRVRTAEESAPVAE